MSIRRPGRLHKRLAAVAPLFTVDAGPLGRWDDDTIIGINTIRGGGSDAGLTTSTATVSVVGDTAPAKDQTLHIGFTDAGENLVRAAVGADRYDAQGAASGTLAERWVGRIGTQEVDDSPTRADPERRSTEIQAADWAAQIALAKPSVTIPATAPELPRLYERLWANAQLPTGTHSAQGTWVRDWDTIYFPSKARTFTYDDAMGKWGANVGTVFRTRRSGNWQSVNTYTMDQVALTWPDQLATGAKEPLTRRQCLSPARWVQPTSNAAVVVWHERTDAGGTVKKWVRAGYNVSEGDDSSSVIYPTERPIRTDDIDAQGLVIKTPNLDLTMSGLAYRLGGWAYNVTQISVDIVQLLTSPLSADRIQAGQLLAMQHRDVVALGHDWPDAVAGLYFAHGITETITKDAWTLTLALMPYRHLTGKASPSVAGITWDTRYRPATPWDGATDTWN